MAERLQVGPLGRPEGLRPQARPVDTTVAPTPIAQTNPALALAESLSAIEPSLQRTLQAEGNRQAEAQAALAERRLAGLTVEEARELIDSGELHEYQNPWFRASFDRLYGGRVAQEAITDLQQRAASGQFDLITGNLDAEIARINTELLDGQGAHFQGGFLDFMDNARGSLLNSQSDAIVAATRQRLLDEASNSLFTAGNTTLDNGGSPAEVAASVRAASIALVNTPLGEGDSGLSMRDTDDLVLGIAAAYARSGHVELIEELLFSDRSGADGSTIPSIASKAGVTEQAARILDMARNERRSQQSANNRMVVIDTREALRNDNTRSAIENIRSGRRDRVRNPDRTLMVGDTVITDSRSNDQLIDDALLQIMDDIETRVIETFPDLEGDELLRNIYAAQAIGLSTDGVANGMTHPAFEELLEDLPGYTLLPEGPVPVNMDRAVLFASSVPRSILLQHADQRTEVFLDAVSSLRRQFGYDRETAIRQAHGFINNNVSVDRISTFGLDIDQAAEIQDIADNEVEREYRMRYVALYLATNPNASMREAKNRSERSFDQRHIQINDRPVRVPQGVERAQWRDTVRAFQEDYVTEFLPEGRQGHVRMIALGDTETYYISINGVYAPATGQTYTDANGNVLPIPGVFSARELVTRRMGQLSDQEWDALNARGAQEAMEFERDRQVEEIHPSLRRGQYGYQRP